MQSLAEGLDVVFNGEGPRMVGFVLMTFPLEDDGRCSFVSNGTGPDDLVRILKKVIDGFA